MAGEWRNCTLGELCEAGVADLQTGPFGTQLHAHDYVDNGVPVVPTEAIRNRQIDHTVLPAISLSKAEELARHRLEPGDILFARRGVQATGHIGYVREAENGFICGTGAIRLRVRKDVGTLCPDFLSHLLANPASVEWFKFHAIGATMPNLNEGIIRSFPLQVPSLPEQRAIAHILSTLDAKIEMNGRMSQTLEALGRTLFKSWFVDFDPARAKREGRAPGLPERLAAQFPDSFEDTELGEIPFGWRLSHLGNEVETLLGGTPSRDEPSFWGGDIPWINSGKANEFRIIEPSEFITQSGLESSATKLLPARTTVIAITGATLGQVSFTEIASCANQSIVGVLGSDAIPSEYVYFWIKENIDRLIASQTGGAQQHINKNDVNELPIICPSSHVVRAYKGMAAPIFERIKGNCFESRTLAALRDTLLPKLISGELRVKNAERLVANAAP